MPVVPQFFGRLGSKRRWRGVPPVIRRAIIGVIGGTVLLIGLVAVLLPGVPAIVVIPLGLLILATEFVWARRWLHRVRRLWQNGKAKKPGRELKSG